MQLSTVLTQYMFECGAKAHVSETTGRTVFIDGIISVEDLEKKIEAWIMKGVEQYAEQHNMPVERIFTRLLDG